MRFCKDHNLVSDNGTEIKESLKREHAIQTICHQIGIKHYLTKPYIPQTDGKVEAFFRIKKKGVFKTKLIQVFR